jgi:hypothetical protein
VAGGRRRAPGQPLSRAEAARPAGLPLGRGRPVQRVDGVPGQSLFKGGGRRSFLRVEAARTWGLSGVEQPASWAEAARTRSHIGWRRLPSVRGEPEPFSKGRAGSFQYGGSRGLSDGEPHLPAPFRWEPPRAASFQYGREAGALQVGEPWSRVLSVRREPHPFSTEGAGALQVCRG